MEYGRNKYPQRRFNRFNNQRDNYIANERIRAQEVRVITDDGENLGVMSTQQALIEARNRELDLVLIAPQANPPVAKIIELSKYKYQEQQKAQKAKAKSKQQETKEFRMSIATGEHDIERMVRRAREFLTKKDKIRFTVVFKGREQAYTHLGQERLQNVAAELADVSKIESGPELKGRFLILTLSPV
jgi:translation initiation factor IF-3